MNIPMAQKIIVHEMNTQILQLIAEGSMMDLYVLVGYSATYVCVCVVHAHACVYTTCMCVCCIYLCNTD